MPKIPEKCRAWKVANFPLLSWWCKLVCGATGGKLCEPWCRLVEKWGLWTLLLTIGLPLLAAAAIVYLVVRIL